MVAIPLDNRPPLGDQPPLGALRVLVEVRHLAPDQEAEPVGPVEPAGILDLLVLASAVEAELLGQLDVTPEAGIARRGEEPPGK